MAKKNVKEMQTEAQNCDKKIRSLQQDTEAKLQAMRREVKTATIEATDSILQHLASMHTRTRLTSWRDTDCPRKDKWQNLVKSANLMIGDRLSSEINRWESMTNFEDEVVRNIVQKFEKRFELLSHEVKEIEGIFLPFAERKTVLDFHRSMKKPTKKPAKGAKTGKDDNFLSVGVAVATTYALDVKDPTIKKMFKEKFEKEPGVVMAAATEIWMDRLNEVSVVTTLNKYFERYMKGIDEVGRLVPSMLKANQTFFQGLSKNLNSQESELTMYPHLSKKCSDVQGELDMFFLLRLLPTDFTADQLEYTDNDVLGRGSFATVYRAKLRTGDGHKIVAMKEPSDHITVTDVTDLLLEESMLREVDNVNIVKYYGMYRKGPDSNLRLNMVMEHCPYTLKGKYLKTGEHAPSKFGNNPWRQVKCIEIMTNLLIQIINGISYLHGKGIAHRDLKPENVLLTERNEVKIADFGLAKKVHEIITKKIGTPVYMAPEVLLLSDKYDSMADIYSFAMINWELWYGTDLAHYASMELQGGLEDSIRKKWRPSLTIVTPPSEFWQDLITTCWDQEPSQRLSASVIGRNLVQVFKEIKICQQQQQNPSS